MNNKLRENANQLQEEVDALAGEVDLLGPEADRWGSFFWLFIWLKRWYDVLILNHSHTLLYSEHLQ